MHEVDLVGIEIEGGVRPQLEIEPGPAGFLRQELLVGALRQV